MTSKPIFPDPASSREGEDGLSVHMTGEEPPTSPRKNRRRHVSLQHYHSWAPNVGASVPENVGIQVTRPPLSRTLDRGMVYMHSDAKPL